MSPQIDNITWIMICIRVNILRELYVKALLYLRELFYWDRKVSTPTSYRARRYHHLWDVIRINLQRQRMIYNPVADYFLSLEIKVEEKKLTELTLSSERINLKSEKITTETISSGILCIRTCWNANDWSSGYVTSYLQLYEREWERERERVRASKIHCKWLVP